MSRNSDPVLVTSARQSPREEMRGRERRYLFTMGLRVVCLLIAILVPPLWAKVVAVAGTVVLPWVAVVIANAGVKPQPAMAPSYLREDRPKEISRSGP